MFAATSLDHRSETRMARNVSFPIQRQKRTHWVPMQRQQQAKSTTNNPASIFLRLWRWIRRFDITKQVCTTSHFRNFLMSKSKWDFLSERRNRRSNAVSIIWARVQQRRFTGEIIVPKQLYFEKALICLCKTCGPSIRTYCYLSPVKRRCWTHVQRDWWVKFCKFSERFCCAQECLGGLKAVIAVHNPKFGH